MMNTELWLKSNITDEWVSMDIDVDLIISVNKSFEEIEDFTTRITTFTKTFNIPQSARNNKFFESAFMVNSASFVDNVVVPAIVKYGGADVFVGDCRLERIINDPFASTYEIFLTQSLPDFVNTIQDIKLIDLDYSEVQHTLTYNNILSTWSYSGGSYTTYTGLTGSIVYPLCHYGYDDQQYYGIFEEASTGFTNPSYPLVVNQFAPWVSLKYLVDKVFERAGFTYSSDFFESDYFNGIFALAKTSNTMGASIVSGNSTNANVFYAQSRGGSGSGAFFDTDITNTGTTYSQFFYLGIENNDPLNIFTPSQTTSNREHFFTTAISGTYKFRWGFSAFVANSSYPIYLNVALRDLDNGTIYQQIQGLLILPTTNLTEFGDIYFSCSIPAARRVGLFYSRQVSIATTTFGTQLGIYSSYLEMFESPNLSASDYVLLQNNLPGEITCLDFIRGIITMFNLVLIPTGDRNFLIERWDDYFSSGEVLDYSSKVDIGTEFSLSPTNDLQREYILRFADSDDRFSFINQQNRNQQFGTYRYFSNIPFHRGTIEVQVPFQPLPISTYDGLTESNMLLPHLYFFNQDAGDVSQNPSPGNIFQTRGSNLRLGFYNGLLDFTITGATKNWYLLSGATAVGFDTYPAISHLSSYEFVPSTFSDLNFGNQYDFWQQINDTYIGFTGRDVYGDFWSGRIAPLYDPDVKILNARMKLTPTEINELQFNDRVYFLEAYWRLLDIVDGDITNTTLVDTRWVKLPFVQQPLTLIPPTYEQSIPVVIPTPTGSTFVSAVFTGNNITDLCQEVGTMTSVFSNCSTLSEGCSVFLNSTATIPVVEGTLLKVSGNNTIYQVIELGILVDFTQC